MLATSCTQQVLVHYGASPCHPGPLMRRVQTSCAWHMAPSTHGWPAPKAAFRTADSACVRACSSSAGRRSLAPVVPPARQAARMPCSMPRLLRRGGSSGTCCNSNSNSSDSQFIYTGSEFDGVEDSVSQTEPQIPEAHVMLPALGSNAAGELDLSEPLIQQQQAEETQSSDSAEPSSGGSPGPGDQGERSEASSKASQKRSPSPPPGSGGSLSLEGTPIWSPKLLVKVAMVLVFGVTNRVLYKQALVPMQNYVFFLAQFQNIGYLAVYFTALWWRHRAGLVTREMLAMNKRGLLAIGAFEAVAQLLFMIGASHLPGPMLPLVNQSYLVWNLVFARLLLKVKFTQLQILGAVLIVVGVVVAAVPPHYLSSLLSQALGLRSLAGGSATAAAAHARSIPPLYVCVCVLCFAFSTLGSVTKDLIFRSERKRLGYPLDIFMVNSFGSLYQSMFVVLLLPVTTAVYGISLSDLPAYLVKGAQCFRGLTPACGSDCSGAPWLPVAYVAANLTFNVSMLRLLRSVGAVTTSLVGSCLVPLTIVAFTLPLPFLERAVMTPNFVAGAVVLLAGLVVYNFRAFVRPLVRQFKGMGAGDSVDLPCP